MNSLITRYYSFNGEIYNYRELKEELKNLGYQFKTETDTEVLLIAWLHYGKNCLSKLMGMFAFLIYDRKNNKIFFARDAFGIKPLYFYLGHNKFLCSSEIAPIISQEKNLKSLNLQKSYDYLIHGAYDDENQTFFKDIYHVKPAEVLD